MFVFGIAIYVFVLVLLRFLLTSFKNLGQHCLCSRRCTRTKSTVSLDDFADVVAIPVVAIADVASAVAVAIAVDIAVFVIAGLVG